MLHVEQLLVWRSLEDIPFAKTLSLKSLYAPFEILTLSQILMEPIMFI